MNNDEKERKDMAGRTEEEEKKRKLSWKERGRRKFGIRKANSE